MDLLHSIAGFLLALFGYSAGAAAAARGRTVVPSAADVAVAPVTATIILVLGVEPLGWWLLPAAAAGGAAVGPILARLRPESTLDADADPPGHPEEDGRLGGITSLRARMKGLLLRTGNFQSRLFLGLFYFVIFAPFALIARLVQDPLRTSEERPRWLGREEEVDGGSLASQRRPY